jgi:hypothetical protein
MWQEIRDPARKTAVNWATKQIRRMTQKKVLERWETKISNCEVTAVHGSLGLKFLPLEKANAIADCLEKQFTPHDLCDENHERRVEARVQALLEVVVNKPPERIRPCDLQKLINSLKLIKARGNDIPNECLRHLPRRPLVHLTDFINNSSGVHISPSLGRKQK